jgi:hypothetical protein
MYVYFYPVHVPGSHVPIIRRINCYNVLGELIDTINSPDDGHMADQNM